MVRSSHFARYICYARDTRYADGKKKKKKVVLRKEPPQKGSRESTNAAR